MSVTTSFKKLQKKYGNFNAPTIEVEVGSTKLIAGKKLQITQLEVELTSGYEASGASFVVAGCYEGKKTDFSDAVDKIQIGEKISISAGYIKTEEIFIGYINQIDYCLGTSAEIASIRVECMDAKGLLMKNRRLEFFDKKKPGDLVREILMDKPVGSYLTGIDISAGPQEDVPLRTNMQTDYDIIVEQANKQGFEFFIVQGKAYFRERRKVTSTIMSIDLGDGLFSARLSLSGQSLVKSVEVRSIDENNGKLVNGKANISGSFSQGSSASKMLGSSKQVFYEAGVADNAEAMRRAEARVETMAENFGTIECECLGIPEIGPGRYIQVNKLSKVMNQKYYITYVRHTIDDSGFHTVFRGGLKSL